MTFPPATPRSNLILFPRQTEASSNDAARAPYQSADGEVVPFAREPSSGCDTPVLKSNTPKPNADDALCFLKAQYTWQILNTLKQGDLEQLKQVCRSEMAQLLHPSDTLQLVSILLKNPAVERVKHNLRAGLLLLLSEVFRSEYDDADHFRDWITEIHTYITVADLECFCRLSHLHRVVRHCGQFLLVGNYLDAAEQLLKQPVELLRQSAHLHFYVNRARTLLHKSSRDHNKRLKANVAGFQERMCQLERFCLAHGGLMNNVVPIGESDSNGERKSMPLKLYE